MNEVKAIIFDFGGTLDNDGVDWFVRLYNILSRRGLTMDQDTFYQYTQQAAQQLDKFADTRHLTMGRTVERFCEQVTEKIKDLNGNGQMNWEPVQIASRFMAQAHKYLERNRSVLEQLQGRYRLGVISNNWGNTAGWCEHFQLSDYFEVILDSTLVGSAKPDQAIFEVALAELALPAEACVYVGDHFENDMFGAHQVGMRTVWLTGGYDKECPDESMVGHRIERLPDILDIEWNDE